MCNRISIDDFDNRTIYLPSSVYNFYLKPDNSSASEMAEQLRLSNIVFVVVILVLISIMVIFWVVIRAIAGEPDIPLDDAILIDRIKGLRNEMNPSGLNTPADPRSEYQMKDNKTPKNTSVQGDYARIYNAVGFVNPGIDLH